jgi:serpin B
MFSSCTTIDKIDDNQDKDPTDLKGDPAEVGPMIESFGFEAFHTAVQLETESENICISPLSISTALAMIWNGAHGTTYSAMADVLKFGNEPDEDIAAGFDKLSDDIVPTSDSVQIEQANGLFWDEERLNVHDDFLELIDYGFKAEQLKLDFNDEQGAKDEINSWIEDKTNGKIFDLIKQIKPSDVMFLINALYYKGNWASAFDDNSTYMGEFEKYDGTLVDATLMYSDGQYDYFEGEDYSAVDLFFKGEDYAMTFILPSFEDAKGDFLIDFDEEDYQDLLENKLTHGRLLLTIPKFELEYELEMKEVLTALGMGIAFSQGGADLTRLGQSSFGRLFIDRVLHKVKLEIDEYGAEGAAVTVVGVGVTSLPPQIVFDRPFYFVLRHVESNAVLFIGLMANPS